MATPSDSAQVDTPERRKARGAFFTPDEITRFIADWAIRGSDDTVFEPSAGDAAFLVQAVRRLRDLSAPGTVPEVAGVEIHASSARTARARVKNAGGNPKLTVCDLFSVEPQPRYTAVIGNPPYIRYQEFSGESRMRARAAALRAGVALTALASSWAAFTVHSTLFLEPGGRMGLVLPAELLSVNYAAAVRQFLFDQFRSVELVLFADRVFPEAEADVLLLLADGFGEGPTDHATIYQAKSATELATLSSSQTWAPEDPAGKWTPLFVGADASEPLRSLCANGHFQSLEDWGDTTLGMVTGNNRFFTLSPARVRELGLSRKDLVRLSPPGSSHLRELELSNGRMSQLGRDGKSTWLFWPIEPLTPAAAAYVKAGHVAGVDDAYKCRVRKPWYRVPLMDPADLLLTCMNADTPRLSTNAAKARHVNSVHGVYLRGEVRDLGRELLPLASLNSVTLLSAEMVGRAYGGGILKLEPREADTWAVPSSGFVQDQAERLRVIRPSVAILLKRGALAEAVEQVDRALLLGTGIMSGVELDRVRQARMEMADRRGNRGRSGR